MESIIPTRQALFQGRRYEQTVFYNYLSEVKEPASILEVTGPAGIGKSSLLKRFEETAKANDVVLLKANLEEFKTVPSVLMTLSQAAKGEKFKRSRSAIKQLEEIWAKIEEASKSEVKGLPTLAKDITGPGIGGAIGLGLGGPLGLLLGVTAGAVGGHLTEIATQKGLEIYTAKGLSVEEMYFAADPVNSLTRAFVEDLNQIANKQRVLLMFDSYEHARHLDEWLRLKLIGGQSSLGKTILVIIASRDPLSPEWTKLERPLIRLPLSPLSPVEATSFLHLLGITEGESISRIIEESNRIPLSLKILAEAQLLAEKSSDQKTRAYVRSQGQIANRLLDHLTSSQREMIQGASILRGFNQDILAATMGKEIEYEDFQTVTNTSLVELRDDKKWMIQEDLRTQIEAELKERSPDLLNRYQRSALDYFSKRLTSSTRSPNLGIAIETIYHAFRFNEEHGLQIFQDVFARLSWPPNFPASEAALTELGLAVSHGYCSKGWDKYFNGILSYIKNDWELAKSIFHRIGNEPAYVPLLRAHALEHEGWIEFHQGNLDTALKIFQNAYQIFQGINDTSGIEVALNHLGRINRRMGRSDLAMAYHQTVLNNPSIPEGQHHQSLIEANRCLGRLWRDNGQWAKAIEYCEASLSLARKYQSRYDEALALSRLSELYCFQGRWSEAEVASESALLILQGFKNNLALAATHANAGRVAVWTQRKDDALTHFLQALWLYSQLSAKIGTVLVLLDLANCYKLYGALQRAENYADLGLSITDSVKDESLSALCFNLKAGLMSLSGEWRNAKDLYERNRDFFDRRHNQYLAAESSLGLIVSTWKVSGSKWEDISEDAKQRLKDNQYRDLSINLKIFSGAVEYEQGDHEVALQIIKEGLADAFKFSEVFAAFLARQIKSQWLVCSDPIISETISSYIPQKNSQTDLSWLKRKFEVNESTGEIKLKTDEPILPLQPGQHLTLLHHGLTETRAKGDVQGRDDSFLEVTARSHLPKISSALLNELTARGVDLKTIAIYSSPTKRTYETAFSLANELVRRTGIYPQINICEDLENIALGSWEGISKKDLSSDANRKRLDSGRDFSVTPPGISSDGSPAESPFQVLNRSYRIISKVVQNKQSAILVGHKISLIVPGILFWAPRMMVDDDGVINWRKLDFPSGGYMVVSHNSVNIYKGTN